MAQDIASQMNNDKWIINSLTNTEWLWSIYGIGEKSIDTISTFFSNPAKLQLLEQLKNYGVNMDPKKHNDLIQIDDSKGNFCITWSFDLPRKKITELFQQQGYTFHESPTKTTDFILIGEKASSKKTKAQELWIVLYEGRETIIQQFPFLKNITPESNKPKIQSLF
jgi:DNA ligase (NAD+)